MGIARSVTISCLQRTHSVTTVAPHSQVLKKSMRHRESKAVMSRGASLWQKGDMRRSNVPALTSQLPQTWCRLVAWVAIRAAGAVWVAGLDLGLAVLGLLALKSVVSILMMVARTHLKSCNSGMQGPFQTRRSETTGIRFARGSGISQWTAQVDLDDVRACTSQEVQWHYRDHCSHAMIL